jgi:hypothetical protein
VARSEGSTLKRTIYPRLVGEGTSFLVPGGHLLSILLGHVSRAARPCIFARNHVLACVYMRPFLSSSSILSVSIYSCAVEGGLVVGIGLTNLAHSARSSFSQWSPVVQCSE